MADSSGILGLLLLLRLLDSDMVAVSPPDFFLSITTSDFLSLLSALRDREDDEEDEPEDNESFFFFDEPVMIVPEAAFDDF